MITNNQSQDNVVLVDANDNSIGLMEKNGST